jgi:hypothetical protein
MQLHTLTCQSLCILQHAFEEICAEWIANNVLGTSFFASMQKNQRVVSIVDLFFKFMEKILSLVASY